MLSIDSTTHWLRPINLLAKRAGERSAGNLHAPFDVAGDGNQLTVRLVGTPEETGSNRSIAPTEPGAIPRPYQPWRTTIWHEHSFFFTDRDRDGTRGCWERENWR